MLVLIRFIPDLYSGNYQINLRFYPEISNCTRLKAKLIFIKKFSCNDKSGEHKYSKNETTYRQLHSPGKDMSTGASSCHSGPENKNKSTNKCPYYPFSGRVSFIFLPVRMDQFYPEIFSENRIYNSCKESTG